MPRLRLRRPLTHVSLSRLRALGASLLAGATVALSDCSGPAAFTALPVTSVAAGPALHGYVAVGRPVAGASIAVKCANGKTYTALSDAGGAYTVSVDAGALPCVFESSGGSVGGAAYAVKLHSIALAAGVVNITPLTDLVVAAFARSSASTYFAGSFDAAAWGRLTVQALQSAQALLIANLQALALTVPATDFFTGAFTPVESDAYDALLVAIAAETAAFLQLLTDSVIAGVVGVYQVTTAGVLQVPSMAGTWNTAETRINRLQGGLVSGVAVGDHCRIDVTSGGMITVTTGTHTWTAQVAATGSGHGTLDSQYAPYHYTGTTPSNGGVAIGWGYFGTSFNTFSDQTPMSTTVRLGGTDAVFCANYRYA